MQCFLFTGSNFSTPHSFRKYFFLENGYGIKVSTRRVIFDYELSKWWADWDSPGNKIRIQVRILQIKSLGEALSIFIRASRDPKGEQQVCVAKSLR